MGAFDGRVVIVTGAARNLGAEYAELFAADGAAVAVADVNGEGAARTAKEITDSGARAVGIEVDVTSLDSTQKMAGSIEGSLRK